MVRKYQTANVCALRCALIVSPHRSCLLQSNNRSMHLAVASAVLATCLVLVLLSGSERALQTSQLTARILIENRCCMRTLRILIALIFAAQLALQASAVSLTLLSPSSNSIIGPDFNVTVQSVGVLPSSWQFIFKTQAGVTVTTCAPTYFWNGDGTHSKIFNALNLDQAFGSPFCSPANQLQNGATQASAACSVLVVRQGNSIR